MFLSSVTDLTTSPNTFTSIKSKSSPNSSLTAVAPVRIAKSSIASSLVGPNPGKSTIFTFILPLTLLASNVAYGCWSTGATINKERLLFITCSNMPCILLTLGIVELTINT